MVMGKFVLDILSIPMTITKQMLEGLRDEVDKERLISEESIKLRLQQFQLMLQDNEISEEEYQKLEDELIERLKAVREYQREVN
jgi:hypothetical protein